MNEFSEIIQKFKEIANMRYTKAVNNNINSAGLTFEYLIGKKIDSTHFPDYKGIEIKTKTRFSRYSISLFSIAFEGPNLFEGNDLLEKYGLINNKINKKELIVKLHYNQKIKYGNYYFEYKLDYLENKSYINIYDNKLNFIEKRAFIDFNSYEEIINVKLNKLALIKASKKVINNQYYFRYYQLTCYVLKSKYDFFKLIEKGIIELTIMQRYGKSGNNLKKNKSKNLVISINEKNIENLLKKVHSITY